MGLGRPTGEYAELMLAADGWPGADEDANYDRSQQYMHVLRQAADVSDHCRHEQLSIFDGDVWSGSAASAADGQLGKSIDALMALLDGLATVITWHRHIAESILQAKLEITDNVEGAHEQIRAVQNNAKLTAEQRTAAINTVVTSVRGTNSDVVVLAAARILGTRSWKPPATALQELLDQKLPPPDESSSLPTTPGDEYPSSPDPAPPGPRVPPLTKPGGPHGGPAAPQPPAPGVPTGAPPSLPGTRPAPGWSPVSPAPAGGLPSSAPTGKPPTGKAPTGPSTPRNPAASTPSEGSSDGDVGPAAAAMPEAQPSGVGPQDDSPRVAPASAGAMPAMPMAPGAAAAGGGGAGGGAGSGSGSGGGGMSGMGGPAGRMPPGKSSGVRPSAATGRSAPRRDSARRRSTDQVQSVEGAAMAAIPVSAARVERDAIAAAATADAARRKGPDRLELARRIAAALNAPFDDEDSYFGFFWVTGVSTGGVIVVANSYGLAYIPEHVQLPEQVYMATADDAIAAPERASWATYPMLAVQGWGAHRDDKLRAVIATEEQLADSDLGVPKVVLQADDIPDRGEMIGRARLEVVDPKAAERLAQTRDARLLALLPPAKADRPEDDRLTKWMEVMRPMIHDDPRRQAPHLQAFHAYVSHAQEIMANEAHAAVDPVAQRCAVGDWLYWKYLTGLLGAALAPADVPVGNGASVGTANPPVS